MPLHQLGEFLVRELAGTVRGDHHARGPRDADRVGDLDQAFGRESRGDDVLGDVTRGVSCRAVDLGGVLAGECAAAVRGRAAVGVHDDLAAGEPAVALGAADLEGAGRVDQVLDVPLIQILGQHRFDDLLDDGFLDLLVREARPVLSREHDGLDRVGLVVHIPDGDLGLGIRAQPRHTPVAAQLGLALDQPMSEINRKRHQLRRLVAGVAEHQALVARALLEIQALAFVHALGDVLRLLAVGDDHRAGVGIEADRRIGVADALDGLARDL